MSAAPLHEPLRLPGLIGELLAEQNALSAVDVFSRRHADGELPAASRAYEQRIPLGRTPRPDQQLAFRVDLDACTGCKACVAACHSLNGLAPEETWREVGLLVGSGGGAGVQQTVTTACHHCEDPACLSGCPVLAYEKDPVTGIVRHLDDQCIGCQYCVLKCPYEVPRYNAELGIVRKCDMCAGRLAQGEAPACVQGCPNGAISIAIVDRVASGPARELLPAAHGAIPDSAYTRPTTRYVSRRDVCALRPADLDRLTPAPAHDPLAVMLVLMQLSVGTLLFEALGALLGSVAPAASALALGLAAAAALAGLGAATLHLGRPLYAFRAFLGWRTSWMSREILAFGAYAPAVAAAAATAALALLAPHPGGGLPFGIEPWLAPLRAAALGIGLVGTACSAMIYADTRRPAWALARTAPLFAGTLVGLGALGSAAALAIGGWLATGAAPLAVAALAALGVVALGIKLAGESLPLAGASRAPAATLRLLRGPLRGRLRARFALASAGLVTAVFVPVCVLGGAAGGAAVTAGVALGLCALGELVERHLFFTAESTPGMPGH